MDVRTYFKRSELLHSLRDRKCAGFSVKPLFVTWAHEAGDILLFYSEDSLLSVPVSPEAKGPQSHAWCLLIQWGGFVGRSLCVLGSFASLCTLLFVLLVCAHWPQSTILCFLFCLHFPKSIYEGNFGCGYLKERRASGLVFCENTTSVYRALFVSPPAPSSVFSEDCPSVT